MSEDIQQDDNNQNSDEVDQDLADVIKQAEENLAGWKRTAADFENYKKRKEAENKELVGFAKEVTITRLLPTLDTLEQALHHMPQYSEHSTQQADFEKKYKNWQTGVNGIVAQLDKTLAELGVKKIETVGKKFDPNLHEAVKEVDGEKDHIIIEELQSGFILNGKVIRPSKVIISKKAVEGGE